LLISFTNFKKNCQLILQNIYPVKIGGEEAGRLGDQKVESQENIHRRARKERREKILIGWLRQKSHIGHKRKGSDLWN